MSKRRYVLIGVSVFLLVASFVLVATAQSKSDGAVFSRSGSNAVKSFSGDDRYDAAAGGALSQPGDASIGSFSGDDRYDPAAGGAPD